MISKTILFMHNLLVQMVNYVIFFCINSKLDQSIVCTAYIYTTEFEHSFFFLIWKLLQWI